MVCEITLDKINFILFMTIVGFQMNFVEVNYCNVKFLFYKILVKFIAISLG